MRSFSRILGVVYDLDGTIIDSSYVHAAAWRVAADKYDVKITAKFLEFQKGRTNEAAATGLLAPLGKLAILEDLVKEKINYADQHASESHYFRDFGDACELLRQMEIQVWICTSSSKQFCLKVYETFAQLSDFVERTVWREMYKNGKSQGLRVVFEKMDIEPADVVYVGDTLSDWEAAQEVGCRFVCYGGLAIKRHIELLSLFP